jgi:hypothetical protein
MNSMNKLLRRADQIESTTAIGFLERAPIDQLEEAVKMLKKHCADSAVRAALFNRVASAPLSEFYELKRVFFVHFSS